MNDFIKQATNVKIETVITEYLTFNNTEEGRDRYERYIRIKISNKVAYYVNSRNSNMMITPNNPFFNTLEEMYNNCKNGGNNE